MMLQTSSLPRSLHGLSSPRSTSSSRTTRVLEELQENLEMIQKEIKSTRAQLTTVCENKENSERENETFIENNKQLRSDIQEVMQILESKQELLDSTKKTYVTTENRVKQLKDEATSARKEMDDLKRREHTIEKECHTITLLKEKQVLQKLALEKSVVQTQSEFDTELATLYEELDHIRSQIIKLQNTDITSAVKLSLENQHKERELVLQDYTSVQAQIQSNHQAFIDMVKAELASLMEELPALESTSLETDLDNCKQDVHSLVSRVKSSSS
ncbi:uncharacterized protein EV154DRAFT_512578 [Mucor mucedo]|uniref:uncharacterized protein n=1 Tax=Mucor mucedo TaxID=29922 RepID=UPI00221F0C0F|nr:uncharacterized protein EV154DRAFT_512578 [Mucor mucedo]KAI7889977.1 hypothetical protein EV154DRAFT_512578 [Mucor mucedo]